MTPVPAWAAVAPDGRIVASTVRLTEEHAWAAAANIALLYFDEADRRNAERAGWRVVRVEIRVMEDGK